MLLIVLKEAIVYDNRTGLYGNKLRLPFVEVKDRDSVAIFKNSHTQIETAVREVLIVKLHTKIMGKEAVYVDLLRNCHCIGAKILYEFFTDGVELSLIENGNIGCACLKSRLIHK